MSHHANHRGRPVIVLGISGSIAAYKAVEVARLLLKAGARVRPVMTDSAKHFIGETTIAGICGEPVISDMFAPAQGGEIHVALGAEADVVALVPATAELLGALAQGRANDVVRATALCAACPVIAAPAMHPRMWSHPATQRNVRTLAADGRVVLVGPEDGEVASGESGWGRMSEPSVIAAAILASCGDRDLGGTHVVVTAGPTVEDIDPARFMSNRSSGKMGFAVAARAAARGARVTLVAGPVSLDTPTGVERVDVRSALNMRDTLTELLAEDRNGRAADVVVMTAAVADYRPAEPATEKMKREGVSDWALQLVANPDLIAEIWAARQGDSPYLVAFALETVGGEELIDAARGKLQRKHVDLVVANQASDAFDRDDNVATLVTADVAEPLERMSKMALADRILDRVVACRQR
ncbi:MAG: bifunctional phosphopantothenoylcysteine decarboxylase/phosphopantothenate--cysteine ligase CoaBC [Polyangiaceae bacterium]